jgi:hypothetical protein
MKFIKYVPVLVFFGLLGAGIQHGQMHLYNSSMPHVHANGVVHIH